MTLRWKQEHVGRYWKVMGSKHDEKNVGTDEGDDEEMLDES